MKSMIAFVALMFVLPSASAEVLIERNISMQVARAIIDSALEQCRNDGHRVVVVVLDRAGQLVGMQRHDGVNPHNFELARRKAFTARTFRQTTAEFFQRTEKQPSTALRNLPDIIWTPGGMPIKIGNETIGGVGVSGAPGGPGDEVCAAAGLAGVAEQLK